MALQRLNLLLLFKSQLRLDVCLQEQVVDLQLSQILLVSKEFSALLCKGDLQDVWLNLTASDLTWHIEVNLHVHSCLCHPGQLVVIDSGLGRVVLVERRVDAHAEHFLDCIARLK